jgi:hypothetical protein
MAVWSDHYRYDKYLFAHAAPTVFAAQVNQASFTYPLAQVTYGSVTTGAYTDIQIGQTVLFGSAPGGSDLGRQRIRKAPTSAILYIGWSSHGVRDGELNLANGAYITVIDDYRAWAKIPRITPQWALYKDYDIAIATGVPSPPVANGGEDVIQKIDSSGEIDVPFDGTNSFATAPGATITGYAWDFADGTPSSAATATVASVVFPQGDRWVHLTVTDSNGKTHTHHILVAAIGEQEVETSYAGAITSATSELSASFNASKAFDGNLNTYWLTAVGVTAATLKIQYPTPVRLTQYEVAVNNLFPVAPVTWTLEASNDDISYIVIDSQSAQTWFGPNSRVYPLTVGEAYLYYRIVITESRDVNQVGITELSLYTMEKNYLSNFEVTTQTLTRNGQTIAFLLLEALPAATYYDGFKVLYGEDEFYNDVLGSLDGPAGRANLKFSGWHDTDTATLESSESTYATGIEVACVDIGGRMRQLPAFPQAVLRDNAPSSWLQLKSANTDRYIHYLLHWHSTVLEVCPFTWSGSGDTYALPRFQSPGQNLWEQIYFRAVSMAYELTVTMRGALGLTIDPMLQNSGSRTATVITDIDPADWMAVTYTYQRPPRVYWLWGNAFVANTQEADAANLKINRVYCVSPGQAPGQGESEQTQGEQIVVDQAELNTRNGHQYARMNSFHSMIDLPLTHPGDIGIDPARMVWVRLTITSALAAQRGLTFTDQRLLPFEVDIVHNNTTQTKEYFLRAEVETVGQPPRR